MADVQPFIMDGISYNIHVMELKRSFSVLDAEKSGRTLDGEMYRDIIGTFYNYTMTVAQKGSDAVSMDAFWDAVSTPSVSHVCVFPYNQQTLTQRMYVTGGSQDIRRIRSDRTDWGDITLNFVAMAPKVTP